jgi:hypothetical protein
MRQVLSTACFVTLSVFTVVAAQTPTTSPSSQATKGQDVTVEGCVAAESAMPGQFKLTNATPSSAATEKSTPSPSTPPSADKTKGVTYNLMGGSDLKPHVGHKVAVTGTLDSSMPKPTTEKPSTEKPSTATPPSGAKDMPAGTLNVKSVKMISTTCP